MYFMIKSYTMVAQKTVYDYGGSIEVAINQYSCSVISAAESAALCQIKIVSWNSE